MTRATITTPGMATPQHLFAMLNKLGIRSKTHFHRPVYTVAESRELRGILPGLHCKTLFLKDKKDIYWLCAVRETLKLDMRALSILLGSARLSFAQPERVKSRLGVEPGAVSPFAIINDPQTEINLVLDESIVKSKIVNFHPLVNDRTTALDPTDLLKFIETCGHTPKLIEMGQGKDSTNRMID